MDYWKECIAEAFDDASIEATDEQIERVSKFVEGAHENYGMAHGHDCISNPLVTENKSIAAELAKERSKVTCKECLGRGSITTHGPHHSATSQCSRCRGEGRHIP